MKRVLSSSFFQKEEEEEEKPEIIKTFFKKPHQQNITTNLRRQIWELYIGHNHKIAPCPLCGIEKISNHDTYGGFEACHIVSRKFFQGMDLNVYYLFPGCNICNNNCSTDCLLDYMFCRGRLSLLKQMLSKIINAFINENVHTMSADVLLGHKIIDYLYGTNRFRIGGGIVNRRPIYEMARMVHYNQLVDEGAKLAKMIKKNAKQLENLMESEIKLEGFE